MTPCRSCSARRRARHRSCTNTLLFQWSDTLTRLFQAAAVGTVSVRSLVEPLRKIAARLRGHLINARAVDLVMSERLLEVETISPNGIEKQRMYIPYVSDAVCWLRARVLNLGYVATTRSSSPSARRQVHTACLGWSTVSS